jgi:hypothetical protein
LGPDLNNRRPAGGPVRYGPCVVVGPEMIWFIVGIFVGALFGFLIAAILSASRRDLDA